LNIIEHKLPGVKIIEPKVFGDHRGWFMETYSDASFKAVGIEISFVQDNQSFTVAKGTLRGLHFQLRPKAQCLERSERNGYNFENSCNRVYRAAR
jgi:dTDP-4-dehydrorhamnose 3,5-epimerase